MSTPTLKLLLNALRLGQPQDPQASIRALAEAIAAQDDVIEDLKRRLQVVQSAAHILEAKASRLEVELESIRRGYGIASPPSSDRPPPGSGPSYRPSAMHQSQHPSPGPSHSSAPQHGPPPVAPQHGPPPSALQQQQHQAQQHHAPQSVRPQHASEAPPPMSTPSPQIPLAPRAPFAEPESEDSNDDFRVATVVVHKKDIEMLMHPEAPFRIAPPGRAGAERGSIPGAPWATGPRGHVQTPVDEFTVDAQHEHRDQDDGETYPGGPSSLAAALGLDVNDPQLRRLRESADELPPANPPVRSRRTPKR